MSGKFGDQVVFRTRNGKSIPANIPVASGKAPAESQVRIRDNFKLAAIWAKRILEDPGMRAAYEAKATNGRTPYVVALTDFLKPPRIVSVDTAGYEGHPGNEIIITAFDGFMVKEVQVKIEDAAGELIEKGKCEPDPVGMFWLYRTVKEISGLAGVTITVIAIDNPGHATEETVRVS